MTDPTTPEDAQAQEQLHAAVNGQPTDQNDTQPDSTAVKDWEAEAEKWKALARKHEGTAKANSGAAKKLAELEDAQKTEAQKLTDQLTAAQVELQTYRVQGIRQEAARQVGLDADLAEYITEADPERALEQATRLAERLKPQAPPPANYQQGARPAPQAGATKDDLIRGLAGFN